MRSLPRALRRLFPGVAANGRRILVTGGAGYIGSHLVALLTARGEHVVVLDNLSTGHRAAVPDGVNLVVADLADATAVDAVLADGPWDAVFHFASLIEVGASMREPFRYLLDNAMLGTRLIAACVRHACRASCCRQPPRYSALRRCHRSSRMHRSIRGHRTARASACWSAHCHWAGRIHGLNYGVLRYFNAAVPIRMDAWRDHDPETHLIPLAVDAVLGRRPALQVFGTDYPTQDGTCIRDTFTSPTRGRASAGIRAIGHRWT